MNLERALVRRCQYLEEELVNSLKVYRCRAENNYIVEKEYHCFAPSFMGCSIFSRQVKQDWQDFMEVDR